MRDTLYNQINPLVRIEEGNLLSRDHLRRILTTTTFQEAKELLRNTPYEKSAEKSDFSERFEYYFRQELARLSKKMYELAPEKKVVDIYTLRYTYHNLKLLTKAYYSEQNLDDYLIADGRFSSDTLKSAIANQASVSVDGMLMESIIDVTGYMTEYENPRAIDIIYDRYYLHHQREDADKLNYPELTKEVIIFIDLTNISTVIRALLQNQGENFLNTVVSSYGSFDKKELIGFANRSTEEFTEFLLSSNYKEVIEPLIQPETGQVNLVLFEKERDDYLTKQYSAAKTQAFGPLPLLALLNAKDNEIKNLQLIFVGKKNNFSESEIEERMRETYGL